MRSPAGPVRPWIAAWAAAAITLLAPPAALSQTAEEIISRHTAALGGRAALEKVQDRVETWSLNLQAFGTASKGTLTLKAKRPDKLTQEVEIDYSGQAITVLHGYDGKSAWEENQGLTTPIEGEELIELRNYALRMNGWELLWAREAEAAVALKGREDLDGKSVFVLEVTPKEGRKVTYFLDAETYLIRKIAWSTVQQGMEIDFDLRVTSYHQVDGVRVPDKKKIENFITDLGVEMSYEMTLEEVEFNTGLEDTDFSNPFGDSPDGGETKPGGDRPEGGKKRGWY